MGSFFSQYNTLRERDFGLTHPNPSLTFAGCVILAFHLYIGNHNSMHCCEGCCYETPGIEHTVGILYMVNELKCSL